MGNFLSSKLDLSLPLIKMVQKIIPFPLIGGKKKTMKQ